MVKINKRQHITKKGVVKKNPVRLITLGNKRITERDLRNYARGFDGYEDKVRGFINQGFDKDEAAIKAEDEIVEKINDIEEINISSHTLLEDQINQILESKKHWKKTFEKILIYFGAIASLIGIIMALMQLNILDITWKLK